MREQGSGEVDVVALAQQLIDIESTTGNEAAVACFLADFLRDRGYSVLEQPVDAVRQETSGLAEGLPPSPVASGFSPSTRRNIIAAVGEPDVVFSTHFDCVPPFFPSKVEDG